jgi:hypothetical protein
MAIKVYSDYEEFSIEEKELLKYLENSSFNEEDPYEDDSSDLFMYQGKKEEFNEDSSFFIVADSEEEELAGEIAEYLGKSYSIPLDDFHKVVFCVR